MSVSGDELVAQDQPERWTRRRIVRKYCEVPRTRRHIQVVSTDPQIRIGGLPSRRLKAEPSPLARDEKVRVMGGDFILDQP